MNCEGPCSTIATPQGGRHRSWPDDVSIMKELAVHTCDSYVHITLVFLVLVVEGYMEYPRTEGIRDGGGG